MVPGRAAAGDDSCSAYNEPLTAAGAAARAGRQGGGGLSGCRAPPPAAGRRDRKGRGLCVRRPLPLAIPVLPIVAGDPRLFSLRAWVDA